MVKLLVGLIVLILVALGAVVGLDYMDMEIPVATDMVRSIPVVGDLMKPKIQDSGNLKISTVGINSRFVENSKIGRVFVITGKAVNGYDKPRARIRVVGRLFTKGKKPSKVQVVYCGNIVSDPDLASKDMKTILGKLKNRVSSKKSNLRVLPGKMIPFMVVFDKLPGNLEEFTVEVMASDPA